ncbi:plasmid partitioning protein [Steroidobacter flavus]|uniref:Plasmid partitioning protein n=1 Tax=Steroidobacter flavus TaxID=1842136 RepID=A0ABV8T4E5_9GAMM
MKRLLTFVAVIVAWSSPPVLAQSRCTETDNNGLTTISCTYQSTSITGKSNDTREVQYQVPLGTAPENGWPVVVMYQGSGYPVLFTRDSTTPYGGLNETRIIRDLLDHGYAVIAPRTKDSQAFWDTNLPLAWLCYTCTDDYTFLSNLFSAMQSGSFGNLNSARWFAAGISSGGYNTSRMAVSFGGKFRALAIDAASYASCAGPLCVLPWSLPANHPPTLFLHGAADTTVPQWTMDQYYDRLVAMGVVTIKMIDPTADHRWIDAAPHSVRPWFDAYP